MLSLGRCADDNRQGLRRYQRIRWRHRSVQGVCHAEKMPMIGWSPAGRRIRVRLPVAAADVGRVTRNRDVLPSGHAFGPPSLPPFTRIVAKFPAFCDQI